LSNYVKSTDFAAKDALLTGNPAKIIKGTEIDTEFSNIATAVSTKADTASPTFTGTPAAPTAAGGTSTTQIATTAFATTAASSAITTERTATATITNKTINLANNTVTGTVAEFNTALSDGNFATIAGTETLTNKTLTSPVLTTPAVDVINEATSGSGVTIDGVLIKDGVIAGGAAGPTVGTAIATNGVANIDFTSLPSWIKRISVIFNSVKTTAGSSSGIIVQLGTSSGFKTSGYYSSSATESFTSGSNNGFFIVQNTNTPQISGIMTLVKCNDNIWVSSHSTHDTTYTGAGGGVVDLAGAFTQLRVKQTNSAAFGSSSPWAGTINIIYE
jgi:hypothetical protein